MPETQAERAAERPAGLAIMIVGLLLSNIYGGMQLVLLPQMFFERYPSLTQPAVWWLTVLAAATCVALTGIWFWRRWGLVLVQGTFLAVLLSDLYFGITLHVLLAVVAYGLLMGFIWPERGRFR